MTRERLVVAVAAIAIIVLFLASISTSNPPGFHRDESDIAYNAATIAASGRDEHGARFPLYFSSMGDWKSSPYIYVLAGVFTIVGPSERAARALSATLGLLAVATLGVLGFRLTRRISIGIATAALAAATPWIFEVTRLVFEVALEPLLISTLLLVLATARDRPRWTFARSAAIGLLLGLIAYAYAGGRPLAPLLALALAVFATRERWRSVVVAWAAFALALAPMAIFASRHPHALFARYDQLSATKGKGFLGAAATIAVNIVHAGSLWQWSIFGDRLPQQHVQGSGGCLLVVGVLLAVASVVMLARRRRWDAFWAFVVLGAFASIVPAALTTSHPHALRAIGIPIFLTALAIPALDRLRTGAREGGRRWALAAALVLGLAQFAFFQTVYWTDGPRRVAAFDAVFPGVFRDAVAAGRPVVLFRRDWIALEDGEWYGRLWRVPVEIVDRAKPPPGSVVVTTWQVCSRCRVVSEAGIFRAIASAD